MMMRNASGMWRVAGSCSGAALSRHVVSPYATAWARASVVQRCGIHSVRQLQVPISSAKVSTKVRAVPLTSQVALAPTGFTAQHTMWNITSHCWSARAMHGDHGSQQPPASSVARSAPVDDPSAPPQMVDADPNKVSISFRLAHEAGSLQDALRYFWKNNINLTRLESRPISSDEGSYEFFVSFVGSRQDDNVVALVDDLAKSTREVKFVEPDRVPWFPQTISDLDDFAHRTLDAGADLESDHPGFNDPVYRARRKHLADVAISFRQGERVPYVEYTQEELDTWTAVYDQLIPLHKKHACKEHLEVFPLLEENCGYGRTSIPQVQDITDYLRAKTGFQLRPVAGLLSSRNFLYGLAFRTFFSTQYIRHSSKPLYTPEPDICHELLGHVPLFANQDFADFSQEIGLASIGASDDQILRLSRCYWFTVEFGLCMEEGKRKAYGAGLLSSFGELEYSMSEEPETRPFDPFHAGEQDYPITTYQPTYYIAESFSTMKQQMKKYSRSFARPFHVRYDFENHKLEVDRNVSIMPRTD